MHPEVNPLPILTICIPTYSRARYLECLLEDLANNMHQLGICYELLIGDNASEDDTTDVVNRYESLLPIRYFRRPENIGAPENLKKLYGDALGRYVVYLADDDQLIVEGLGRCIRILESNPNVGAVFAPWYIYDRVSGEDYGCFYSVEHETLIAARDHSALFCLIINAHIFPEIYVIRASLARKVALNDNRFAFYFFVQIALMLDQSTVIFSPEPFYRSITRYFEGESRTQAGIEQVKFGWDMYRGGLEYLLSRFSSSLSMVDLESCHRAIDQFTRIRMQVGLRLRTHACKDWIDNYYIASRLLSTGGESLLPASYESYRINAALEYLLGMQPFYPEQAEIFFYLDDPPQILSQAHNFSKTPISSWEDKSKPLGDNAILLTSINIIETSCRAIIISEAELMARFP